MFSAHCSTLGKILIDPSHRSLVQCRVMEAKLRPQKGGSRKSQDRANNPTSWGEGGGGPVLGFGHTSYLSPQEEEVGLISRFGCTYLASGISHFEAFYPHCP